MQTPVRYYITQSDDRAVVRTIPVAVPQPAPVDDAQKLTMPQPEAVETRPVDPGRTRVTRLMRASVRRAEHSR